MSQRIKDGDLAPLPKRRSTRMDLDVEELLPDKSWRSDNNQEDSKKRKRGPGRPRKPDHELARPRRPSTAKGAQPPKSKVESSSSIRLSSSRSKEVVPKNVVPAKKAGVSDVRTKDQVTIAAQKQQIETMQEKIEQYEARLKAMETHHRSTPPTPAMSVIQSTSHAHPLSSQYSFTTPGLNAHESYHPIRVDGAIETRRDDSPLSEYSDLWPPELLSSAMGIAKRESDLSTPWDGSHLNNRATDGKGKRKAPSLIITLKANPLTTPTPSLSPVKRTARQEFESGLGMRTSGGRDQYMPFGVQQFEMKPEILDTKMSERIESVEKVQSSYDKSLEDDEALIQQWKMGRTFGND